jgi:uncharacterized RDD family membrane protein YckC
MVVDPNPYAPTKAALNEVPSLEPCEAAEPASRWRRLANLLLDLVGVLLLSLLAGILLGIVSVVAHIDVSDFTGPAFSFSIVVLYYFVSEALFARTLGKLVTGTQVVTESGGRPGISQILARSLYRFVPFEAFSFLSRRRPGWHDRWSKTRVVIIRRR